MIILLHGPDDYRRERKRREIIAEFRRKRPAGGFTVFDFAVEEDALERLREFSRTASLFEPEKFAVILGAAEADSKELVAELKTLSGRRELTILVSEKSVPVSGPFGFLRKVVRPGSPQANPLIRVQEFPHLDGSAWLSFIKTEAEARGASLTPAAIRFLAEVCAKDAWRLTTELDKLALLNNRSVDVRDLESFGFETAQDFRQTMSALGAPAIGRRLAAVESFFAQNEPAAKIFNIAAAWMPGQIKQFADLDLAVKSGKLDYEEALIELAISG